VRATRLVAAASLLALAGAIAWDIADDRFWSRHALFTGLLASVIVVAVTAAGLNELLARRQRQRWSVLAQYALFQFVRDTARVTAAMGEVLANPARRERLQQVMAHLLGHSQEVLGRWADVMVNSGTYAEIIDRHVELYSRLYWWGSVLDEADPLEEQSGRPKLSRVSLATQAVGPVEEEWLRDNLVAIAQLAESLDRWSFELAMRIVPLDWWSTQLPERPSAPADA
jgi:hypothetical protein